jgi:DNA-binding NarL/FixJ family response regulator
VKIGEITGLIADGWKNKEIAAKFGTTEQTVKNYVVRVADKIIGQEDRATKNVRVMIARWHWNHANSEK